MVESLSVAAISQSRNDRDTERERKRESLYRYKSELGAWSMVPKIDKTCIARLSLLAGLSLSNSDVCRYLCERERETILLHTLCYIIVRNKTEPRPYCVDHGTLLPRWSGHTHTIMDQQRILERNEMMKTRFYYFEMKVTVPVIPLVRARI